MKQRTRQDELTCQTIQAVFGFFFISLMLYILWGLLSKTLYKT